MEVLDAFGGEGQGVTYILIEVSGLLQDGLGVNVQIDELDFVQLFCPFSHGDIAVGTDLCEDTADGFVGANT